MPGQRLVAQVLHRAGVEPAQDRTAGMALGQVGFRDGIAILQVVVFTAFLPAGLWFKATGRLGWFGVTFLSLFRLVGASCLLAAINAKEADGLWAGVLVCESFGILVLFFLLLEMLERL